MASSNSFKSGQSAVRPCKLPYAASDSPFLAEHKLMNSDSPLFLYYKSRLARSPIFRGLSDDVLADMLECFRPVTWNKGVATDPASLVDRFHLIINGRVKMEYVDATSGNWVTLFVLGPGDGFDIVSLLDGKPHEASPVALEDVQLLSAPTEKVREWISRHPDFNRNFLPYLGERMRKMEDLVADLGLKDTITRLAHLILRHTVEKPSADEDAHPVKLIHDLTNESLAHMIGSTRQAVNRHLQELRKKGILDSHPGHLVVRELEALKKQADAYLSHRS
ncbi:MAG: hypothetical protein DSZ32_06535 [Gammaproteobacteria bacterium]|nr:MAG: hypothetical protein DSZ32_06535 [Gammaproteobacteria bacterium]RTZ59298.1 MAG: hypothetical protein DSZ33_04585 [Gammaproteobacteria bacterium]